MGSDVVSLAAAAETILDAVEQAIPKMARHSTLIITQVVPLASDWDELRRARFERGARSRFEAVVALTRREPADDSVLDELAEIGIQAALDGSDLPTILDVLRTTRDLMVQTAVAAAGQLGPGWDKALAVALTRILPVFDRLADAVARGYWSVVASGRASSGRASS